MQLLTVFICVVLSTNSNGARILVYIPTPSISHQEPFRPLTQELAKRGHEVTVITTDPAFPKVPPSVVYMRGVHKRPQKELPSDLKSYLDSSIDGVIYMSFGTNTDPTALSQETIQMFVKVFCQLPYDVLWKWSQDELPGRCSNIRIGKWFPQSDLLRHPKIKLFVTQGGMQSTDEAIFAGVPLLGIPMLGDQWYNVEKYKHLKIGLGLDFETVTEEQFRDAVTTIIGDDSYRQNIRHLDVLMRDEPMSGLQRAVWWTEHVLRHGGARHLRAPAANISWAEYLELEFVAILVMGCESEPKIKWWKSPYKLKFVFHRTLINLTLRIFTKCY
ncbi:UDP-glucoronosyl and UDP-glucosyl transferase domain-containing protein [Phthorimaea operculella]|nr:UDP-glucoronosyl and UDP-glucosyl transferase domain-containing protein [Phthorimaea operculella]